jgi:uncharacterized protein YjbJ (UPF0337 family)
VQFGAIDVKKLRGVGDKGLGLAKETFGVLFGSERLQKEGEAQQERASAELKALREEVRAEKEDMKAEAQEKRERAAQRAKASS